jgi:hypothetical protein
MSIIKTAKPNYKFKLQETIVQGSETVFQATQTILNAVSNLTPR